MEIVAEKHEAEALVIGALVDSVEEVIELEPEMIEPAPKLGIQGNIEHIRGIGKRDEKFIILLDMESMFNTEDLTAVKEAGKAGTKAG